VIRLAILAALILVVAVLAGDPPPSCAKIDQPVTYDIYVGPSRTITITFDATQWGIPKLGSWITIPKGDSLTVAADPQPSDGKWDLTIVVNYIEGYYVTITKVKVNCSGTIRTWTSVEAYGWKEKTFSFTLKNQPLMLSYTNSWTINVAPPLAEAVPGADEYDPKDAANWPKNDVIISYVINGAYKQLSGLSPSTSSNPSWNYGQKVASYVPESLQLVFLSGNPPAAETYGLFGGKCSGQGPGTNTNSYSESISCKSYGSIDIKITAGLEKWIQHTLKFWTFAGIAGYLENFLYVIDAKNNYVALYQNDKGYVPIPCKPPFNATRVAYVDNPPKGKMEALSVALWDKIGRPIVHSGTTWDALMTYGKIEKTDVCYSDGSVEAGVVYVWHYSPDLPGRAWIELGGAKGEASGTGELRPTIYVWLPRGGVYNGKVKVGGEFTGLDGAVHQIGLSGPTGWREELTTSGASAVQYNIPCPDFAKTSSGGCIPKYDMAWDEQWIELGTNSLNSQRTLWHWEYPLYGGGTALYWVGWHSRAIIRPSWSISYIAMHPGWIPVAWSTTPPMPDSQTSLAGDVSFVFVKNYDVTKDLNVPCGTAGHSGSPPVTVLDSCGKVDINSDVALAFGAQPVFLPMVNQTNNNQTNPPPPPPIEPPPPPPPPPPPQPLGDCVMVQPALASLAQGAYAFNPRVYATAPFHVVWPGAPFVLVVGMPYSANCPSTLTATIRVYAHHMRKGFIGFINTTLTLSQGQWYYVGPSGAKPFTKAMCGQFIDTGLDDWYNALQKPGIYSIVVEYSGKSQYFHYEVRPVKLIWESYTPNFTSINVPTGVVVAWMWYVNTTTMAQWWPYGAGRGGLALQYGCGAMYWSEDLPGEFAYSTHFGDLAKARVQYIDLMPKVQYLPGRGVEFSINAPVPPSVKSYVVAWYVYVNRGGAWRLVGYVANNSTKLFIPQVNVPVWPWDPVMIVPTVFAYGEGDPIYHYKPGYYLFFNFWSLPLKNPPPQSDPAALVRLLGGVVVGP